MSNIARKVTIGASGAVVAALVIAFVGWGVKGHFIELLGGLTEESLTEIDRRRDPERPAGPRVIVPVGAVVAFDLMNGGCPEDWDVFTPGNDKFIVGTGKQFNVPDYREHMNSVKYDTGGATHQKIQIAHLPPHTHELVDDEHTHSALPADSGPNQGYPKHGHNSFQSSDRTGVKNYMGKTALLNSKSNISIKKEGRGELFDTLPPYVALTYCKKMRDRSVW